LADSYNIDQNGTEKIPVYIINFTKTQLLGAGKNTCSETAKLLQEKFHCFCYSWQI